MRIRSADTPRAVLGRHDTAGGPTRRRGPGRLLSTAPASGPASAEAVSARRVCRAACLAGSLPAGFLAGHDRTGPVAVTARDRSGGRSWWPAPLPPAQPPRPGQGDHRAQAAARRDPQAHAGQLGPEGEDQGGPRPDRDRGAGDHHAAQQPQHDPHAASSRQPRTWRRFPDGRSRPTAVTTRPGPPGEAAVPRRHLPRASRGHERHPYRPPVRRACQATAGPRLEHATLLLGPSRSCPVRPVSPGREKDVGRQTGHESNLMQELAKTRSPRHHAGNQRSLAVRARHNA